MLVTSIRRITIIAGTVSPSAAWLYAAAGCRSFIPIIPYGGPGRKGSLFFWWHPGADGRPVVPSQEAAYPTVVDRMPKFLLKGRFYYRFWDQGIFPLSMRKAFKYPGFLVISHKPPGMFRGPGFAEVLGDGRQPVFLVFPYYLGKCCGVYPGCLSDFRKVPALCP